MTQDNAGQREEWNGPLGERWATFHEEIEAVTGAFGDAAIACAAPVAGESVLDIGCGAGSTTFLLADAVGPEGEVIGVDVSRPLLEVARSRLSQRMATAVSFLEADASDFVADGRFDLMFSRFGVMFFADPVAAFASLRRSLKPGGRLVFVCWRAPRENLWAVLPLAAARAALGVEAAPVDPHAPGPFAFADPERLRNILTEAGFGGIDITPFDAPVRLGKSPEDAAASAARIGPLSRLVREVGEHRLADIVASSAAALRSHCAPDGSVVLGGGAWIASAVPAR